MLELKITTIKRESFSSSLFKVILDQTNCRYYKSNRSVELQYNNKTTFRRFHSTKWMCRSVNTTTNRCHTGQRAG